jgi:hypothetical protein
MDHETFAQNRIHVHRLQRSKEWSKQKSEGYIDGKLNGKWGDLMEGKIYFLQKKNNNGEDFCINLKKDGKSEKTSGKKHF